ncbi:MAG: gliding motility lipoprotein GldB, partial [Flavobacterium sp.]|nr:gliding motility lipoprotein GldB [Flavobacterium sp.]
MKKILLIFMLVLLASCDKKSAIEKQIEEIPVSLTVERFDKIFYETPVSDFVKMKKKYPEFF